MDLSLAFFHGVQGLIAFAIAALIIVIGVPLVFYIWLRHTKSSELKLTLIYASVAVVVCGLVAIPTGDSQSLFHGTVFILAFILTLPWNAITFYALTIAGDSDISDPETAATMLLSAGVNAVALFFLAKKARRWKD